jgi:hypothetical protein
LSISDIRTYHEIDANLKYHLAYTSSPLSTNVNILSLTYDCYGIPGIDSCTGRACDKKFCQIGNDPNPEIFYNVFRLGVRSNMCNDSYQEDFIDRLSNNTKNIFMEIKGWQFYIELHQLFFAGLFLTSIIIGSLYLFKISSQKYICKYINKTVLIALIIFSNLIFYSVQFGFFTLIINIENFKYLQNLEDSPPAFVLTAMDTEFLWVIITKIIEIIISIFVFCCFSFSVLYSDDQNSHKEYYLLN